MGGHKCAKRVSCSPTHRSLRAPGELLVQASALDGSDHDGAEDEDGREHDGRDGEACANEDRVEPRRDELKPHDARRLRGRRKRAVPQTPPKAIGPPHTSSGSSLLSTDRLPLSLSLSLSLSLDCKSARLGAGAEPKAAPTCDPHTMVARVACRHRRDSRVSLQTRLSRVSSLRFRHVPERSNDSRHRSTRRRSCTRSIESSVS